MDATEISVHELPQRTEGYSSRAHRRRFSPYSTQTTSSSPASYTSSLPPTQRRASTTHIDDQALNGCYLPTPASEGTRPGWNDTVYALYYEAPLPSTLYSSSTQSPSASPHMPDFASGSVDLLGTYASPDSLFDPTPDTLSSAAIENPARTGISSDADLVSSPVHLLQTGASACPTTPPSEQNSLSIPRHLGVSLSADHAGGLYRSADHEAELHRDDAKEDEGDSILSISTAFHPGSLPHLPPADVIIVSSDGTLFYVHAAVLRSVAPHVFHTVLHGHGASITLSTSNDDPTNSATATFEDASCIVQRYLHSGASAPHTWLKMDLFPADQLNIMLHAFYNTSCVAHQPSIEVIESTLDKISNHLTLNIDSLAPPSSALFAYLIGLAPFYPLRVYTIGARYQIHDLAVKASSHLLSLSLFSLTDDEVVRMGAVYLKKLYLLHVSRTDVLRDLLLKPPHPHPPGKACGFKEQKTMEGLWASVVVNLAWDVRPDLSTSFLQRSLSPVTDRLECALCRETLDTRIRDIVKSWASVPHCIT